MVEEWQETIGWYGTLIEKYPSPQEGMLDFVRWLAASEYATWMYPSNSHAALGLSTVRAYPDRRKRPMVYLAYDSARASFDLIFQEGQGNTARTEWVTSPREPAVMNRIADWLRRDALFDR